MSKLVIDGGNKVVTLAAPIWPHIGDEEIVAVDNALRASRTDINYLTSVRGGGPTEEFEQKLARFFGTEYALATNSGCAALHTALMAIGLEAGDEVIVSPYTWGQTVSPILQQCAIPIFADIDHNTYNLDPHSVEQQISPETKAIMVVHLYGQPADMDPIMDIARKNNLRVIEDCAHAPGATYKGRRVGTIGDIGCFSIGDGKQIVGGEGGFLLTNQGDLYDQALINTQIRRCLKQKLNNASLIERSDSLLHTYNIHPLAAVICGVQLVYLDQWNNERRQNGELLSEGLRGVPGIRPVWVAEEVEHVYHHYSPSFVPEEIEGVSREVYVEALVAEGVDIDLGYVRVPIHLWNRMQKKRYFGKGYPWKAGRRQIEYRRGDCPVAEARCNCYELDVGDPPAWRGDQTVLIRQYLDAFYKLAENIESLRYHTQKR